MMEMHAFQNAKQLEIPSLVGPEKPAAQDLIAFLFDMSAWTKASPQIIVGGQRESDVLYALFRGVAFVELDFWQVFGPELAVLMPRWKIDAFTNADSTQESVWLALEKQGAALYGVQKTLSGRASEMMQELCLRIVCESPDQARTLRSLFQSTDWNNGIAALEWEYHAFLEQEKIPTIWQNCCFCYGGILEKLKYSDCVQALDFHQKKALWSGFLRDRFDYAEFEWVYQLICQNHLNDRVEWELSLHAALQDQGYTVDFAESKFKLYNGQKRPCYFNFDSHQYAQRALLKIMFPLNF